MGLVGPLVGGIVGGLGVTSASVASALWQRIFFHFEKYKSLAFKCIFTLQIMLILLNTTDVYLLFGLSLSFICELFWHWEDLAFDTVLKWSVTAPIWFMMNIIFSEARLSQIFWTWGVGCDVKAQLAFPRSLQRYKLDFNTKRTLTVFFLKVIRNGAIYQCEEILVCQRTGKLVWVLE